MFQKLHNEGKKSRVPAYHTKYIAKVEKKGDFIWFFKYYVYICSEISIRYL